MRSLRSSKQTTISGRIDMVDIAKILEGKVDEDAVVGGAGDSAPAGDVVSGGDTSVSDLLAPSGAISDDDVLGHCDHHKNGFMATGCFHIPKHVLKNYRELPSKKKKGHKNPYLKGMLMVTEADLDKKTIMAIHALDSTDILNFVNSHYDFPENKSAKTIEAIAYWPKDKLYFIKVILDNGNKRFVLADFEVGKKSFIANGQESYSTEEVMDKYVKDNKQAEMWVVYGAGEIDEADDGKFFDLDDIMTALADVPEKYLDSQIHVGPYGRHVGDIESIDEDYPRIYLNLKKAHTSMHRGPVEGCMKAKDLIEQLSKLQKKYAGKKVAVYVAEQIDALSKQLGKKPTLNMVINVEIAKVDGIWFRI